VPWAFDYTTEHFFMKAPQVGIAKSMWSCISVSVSNTKAKPCCRTVVIDPRALPPPRLSPSFIQYFIFVQICINTNFRRDVWYSQPSCGMVAARWQLQNVAAVKMGWIIQFIIFVQPCVNITFHADFVRSSRCPKAFEDRCYLLPRRRWVGL